MKLKVANILLDGRFGGPQNRVLQVSDRLRNHDIETIVIIPNKNSEAFLSRLKSKRVAYRKMELHRLTKDKRHLMGWAICLIPEIISLSAVLKKEKIDICHCNTSWQVKSVLAGKLAGCKIVWHLNDTELSPLLMSLFNRIAPLADGFIVAGSNVRKYYLENNRLRNKKYIEIQAPVDTKNYDPLKATADSDIMTEKGLRIVTMGTINPTKRIEDFISAANILNKERQDLNFYIIGPELENQKKYLSILKNLISMFRIKNLRFLGPDDNIPPYLKKTDIYVCPSQSEASPMAVWEAMAMEKAIVSTDVGDVSRFLKNGQSAFIVPPQNPSKLAEKIRVLINDERLRRQFGRLARESAIRNLDIEICVEKHRHFYEEIMGIK